MSEDYITDKEFRNEVYDDKQLSETEFELCSFHNCDFSGVDSRGLTFNDCRFLNCNFSSAKIHNATLQNVEFHGCKILGVNFEYCNELAFKVKFKDCQLDFASFNGLAMKKTEFINCSLKEADFTTADITGSLFENCDLHRAVFQSTKAENVDFATSYKFSIDPEMNHIKRSKFSVFGLKGLLEKYDLVIEST